MTTASMPTEWIKVDDSKYESDEKHQVRNVTVHLSRSPYDVPQQLRSCYDEKAKSFVVELKYLDDEPTREVRLDHDNYAHIGKRSNRIYSIELASTFDSARLANETELAKLREELQKAFDDLRMVTHVRERATNYSLTKKIVEDNWTALSKLFVLQRAGA